MKREKKERKYSKEEVSEIFGDTLRDAVIELLVLAEIESKSSGVLVVPSAEGLELTLRRKFSGLGFVLGEITSDDVKDATAKVLGLRKRTGLIL